jgi:hypothetical protein
VRPETFSATKLLFSAIPRSVRHVQKGALFTFDLPPITSYGYLEKAPDGSYDKRTKAGRRTAMSKPCSKRDALFARWNAASIALDDLEGVKNKAITDSNQEFSEWDSRIQAAREEEELAQREYERHIAIDGCNE